MKDIIKITKSLEDSRVWIYEVTETVRHEIGKQESGFLAVLLALLAVQLVQPVISQVVKGKRERGVRKARKGYMDESF